MRSFLSHARTFALLAVLGLSLVSIGCSTYTTSSGADTSASNLAVTVGVNETLDLYKGQPIFDFAQVSITFKLNETPIQLTSGETITCNGTPLGFFVGSYGANLHREAVGGQYHFVYTRNGVATTIDVPAKAVPDFIYPTSGAEVPRLGNLIITYMRDSTSLGILFISDRASTYHHPDSDYKPETGIITYDASTETAGSGTLGLERRFKSTLLGTGFKSASVEHSAEEQIIITWLA